MNNFFNSFFSPLGKDSCMYFLFVSGLFFFTLLIVLFFEIIYLVKNFKKLNPRMLINGILLLFNCFIAYFVNRIFYSMCVKSLI